MSPDRVPKSIGAETTFGRDLQSWDEVGRRRLRRFSSSAGSRTPSSRWTPGRQTRRGSAATGCGRTPPGVAGSSPPRHRVACASTQCRGLVAAARGEIEAAVSLLEAAAAQHEAVGDPFGRARALLELGVTRRRARQKRGARESIESAADAFEELGAAGWAERARRELGSIGGRTRTDDLTPAEQRVADLVAKGRTNAEVAAALFLAERTVASHLTRVYAKLGVRSRTELAHRLGEVPLPTPQS